ncbi:alginate lyase family protein [Aureibaculum algae]|uniref:alginate lyase family protein n=1 Tax=Aureibaculum algae TaxID=2584122 RepID=UPI0015861E5C|nr:alginate lyase family protein [Aureibaculum algae]
MNLTKLKLIYNTVKHLRFKQIYFRLFYAVRNKFFKRTYSKNLPTGVKSINWENKVLYSESYLGEERFNFLNIEHDFQSQINWNYNDYGKLWTYNLNYFDFLNQENFVREQGIALIEDYIKQDVELKDGKDPYPISLRTINWIKFLSQNKISNQKINQTLYNHFQILLHNLEFHILGNHLLENAFALFFGGIYFNDKKLSSTASKLLKQELNEQLLEDGAHFELSPMYHKILLHRLLDCIYLAHQNKKSVSSEFIVLLEAKAIKMLSWLQTVTFNNGSIPMVNDSAYKIALSSAQLFTYAKQLNLKWSVTELRDSGYRKFSNETLEVFMDVGKLAVDYQPGHAHADTFSFVYHSKNNSIIVDPAVSTYEINKIRERERSTGYHNTVTVHQQNSSQVWSGFRVAKRANVKLELDTPTKIIASHNGYKGCTHTRTFNLDNDILNIHDKIEPDENGEAHFHFHPDCSVQLIEDEKLIVNNIEMTFFDYNQLKIEDYHFANGFNTTIIAKKVVVLFTEKVRTEIKVIS